MGTFFTLPSGLDLSLQEEFFQLLHYTACLNINVITITAFNIAARASSTCRWSIDNIVIVLWKFKFENLFTRDWPSWLKKSVEFHHREEFFGFSSSPVKADRHQNQEGELPELRKTWGGDRMKIQSEQKVEVHWPCHNLFHSESPCARVH